MATIRQTAGRLMRLSLPLIGAHLAQMGIQLVDTLMLGRYSAEALASAVLATSLFFVIFIVGSGFALAVMPLVAAAEARGDARAARRLMRMGLVLSLLYSLAALPLMWFSGDLLGRAGQPPEMASGAERYLRVAMWGLFPALAVMVFRSTLSALGRTRMVLAVTLGALIFNAAGDWLLIFGRLGLPEMGLVGAALASVMMQIASALGLAFWLGAAPGLAARRWFERIWRLDPAMLTHLFRTGWPIGVTMLAETGLFSAAAMMMGWLGAVPLAAHGIALQLAAMSFMIYLGLANGATILVGEAWGRCDLAAIRTTARAAALLAGGFALLATLVFLLWPEWLVALFLDPADPAAPAILALGRQLVMVAALFQLADGAQVLMQGLLRGMADTRVPMVLAALTYWGVGMSGSWAFGIAGPFGGVGVWLGLVIGLGAAAALLGLRFSRLLARTERTGECGGLPG